jgi:hypothetical protein
VSDEVLTIGAVTIELGVPLLAGLLFWRLPMLRPNLVVVLGALTPALLFYAAMSIAYVANPDDTSNRFAFFAGWGMTFFAYLVILVAGVALSFAPWPRHLFGRFAVGLLPVVVAFISFVL